MDITVLIANKNYGQYLDKAIRSCVSQTLQPKCICIIDDGSTDDSWEVISKWIAPNQREEKTEATNIGDLLIKVGSINDIDIVACKVPKSVGPAEARNLGISLTRQSTEIYAILDADDEMLSNKLELCSLPFRNPNIGVVYANYYNVNSETGLSLLEIKEPFDIFRLQQECIVHSGSLIRATALDKAKDQYGYYDKNMRTCEDWDLWIRLSKVCGFYHIAESLTNVLVHPNNSTNSVPKEVWMANWQRIAEKYK